MALTVSVSPSSVGARLLHLQRTLPLFATSSRQTCSLAKMGRNPLQLGTTVPARKLVVQAARTESKRASLGSRAPHFEVLPLTSRYWTVPGHFNLLEVGFIDSNNPFFFFVGLAPRATYWESVELGRLRIASCFAGKVSHSVFRYMTIVLSVASKKCSFMYLCC